jgi:hypothetical protein
MVEFQEGIYRLATVVQHHGKVGGALRFRGIGLCGLSRHSGWRLPARLMLVDTPESMSCRSGWKYQTETCASRLVHLPRHAMEGRLMAVRLW